jgi:2-keto-3-deoxy-L-rhamnonate aldolase RhmA
MRGKGLKEKFSKNEYTYGTHVVGLVNPLIPEWMADSTIDFAFICTEHMPLDRSEVSQMCKSYASVGISPMVRIPYPDAQLATIAVEGGAEGIVAPYVEKPSQLKSIADALRYRPIKGELLEQFAEKKRLPSPKLAEYLDELNEHLYLVAGVESVYAMENLEVLLETPGVAAVFLGPHDISCSLEIPCEYTNPIFIDKVSDCIRRCRKAGKPVCLHVNHLLPQNRPFLEAGLNMILNASDVITSIYHMREELDFIRREYESR